MAFRLVPWAWPTSVRRDSRPHFMNNLKRYYRLLWDVKWTFSGGLLAGAVYSLASGAGLPTMAKTVFPILFHEEGAMADVPPWMLAVAAHFDSPSGLLLIVCFAIPLVFVVRGVAGYFNTYWINKAGLQILENIRVKCFEKIQRLPWSFFQGHRSGDLASRMGGDSEILRSAITQSSNDLIKQPLTFVAAIGYLIREAIRHESAFFALIGMIAVPLCIMPIMRARKKISKRSRVLQAAAGDLTSVLVETLQSPLEIRVYQLEKSRIRSFSRKVANQLRLQLKIAKYRALISPSIEIVASMGFAFALYLGVQRGLKLNDFMAMGMALYMAFEPLKKMGSIASNLAQGNAAAERINAVLDAEETVTSPAQPVASGRVTGRIELRDVNFSYGDTPVLRGVNLQIQPGEMVALVGPSGSGKTTLSGLIPRLFDATSGAILIDGTDVRDWDLHALRSQIAVVPQMPALFQESIADNIRSNREDASREAIVSAARRAHADDFLRRLPEGYDTVVGERGSTLSGGQRQRVAMARAFFKDAPILILDEATSALDVESEAAIAENLKELAKGRTTIVIAHRLSTIRIAQRVILLQNGRITGDGTLSELGEEHPLIRQLERE